MSRFVQTLESRTLFSVTIPANVVTDIGMLLGDSRALRADFQTHVPVLHADFRAVGKDLKGLPNNGTNHALLGKLRGDAGHWMGVVRGDMAGLLHAGTPAVRHAIMDGMRVFMDPNDLIAKAKLAADLTAVQSVLAAPMATLATDVQSAGAMLTADLNALTAANPTDTALQGDVNKVESDGSAMLMGVGGDVQKLNSDVTQLVTDLTAV
jgi:hypothetical protein